MSLARLLMLSCLWPLPGQALDMPAEARRAAVTEAAQGSLRLPITPWQPGGAQTVWAEGVVRHEAWQIPAEGLGTLEILAPLRAQLLAEGWEIVFECADRGCGGFDFRYGLEVLPEPEMHVDLGDYRYVTAERMGATRAEYVALIVSRAAGQGFVHLTRVGPEADDAAVLSTRNRPLPATVGTDLADLTATGRMVLEDLRFARGAAELEGRGFASLAALADYLRARPERRVVLVGHTDAEGALESNIALSRARAEAVRRRLVERYGLPAAQIAAEGVGYLAPLMTNGTAEGRDRNRRVEVVLADP